MLPLLVALGVGAAVALVLMMPPKVADVRRAWAMVAVEARVAEHRDVPKPAHPGPRSGGPYTAHEIRVEYDAGGERQSAWLHFSATRQRGGPPGAARPPVGAAVGVWYHPDAPGEPSLREPRRWEPVFNLVFATIWLGLLVLAGFAGTILAAQRVRRWLRP